MIQAIAAGYQAAEGLYRALGKVRYARLPHWNRMRRVRFTGYADTPALRRRNQMAMEEPADRCTSFCEICHVYPEQDAVVRGRALPAVPLGHRARRRSSRARRRSACRRPPARRRGGRA